MTQPAPQTKRQREVLNVIQLYIRAAGYAPSLEEIGIRMNLSSLATIHKHLENLQEKGYISRRRGLSRSIEVLPVGESCPTCGRSYERAIA